MPLIGSPWTRSWTRVTRRARIPPQLPTIKSGARPQRGLLLIWLRSELPAMYPILRPWYAVRSVRLLTSPLSHVMAFWVFRDWCTEHHLMIFSRTQHYLNATYQYIVFNSIILIRDTFDVQSWWIYILYNTFSSRFLVSHLLIIYCLIKIIFSYIENTLKAY